MNPFRELFVEVAQGLLEAAAIEAQQRKAQRPSVRLSFNEPPIARPIARLLCERFGWLSASTWRAVRDHKTKFGVVMCCGHRHVFGIDDWLIEDSKPGKLLDVIEDHWRASLKRRKCHCVDPGRVSL